MNNDSIDISRRKILGSLGAVGVASAGAGYGTSAYFSDSETFEGNELVAGELDLLVDWQQLYWGMPEDHPLAPYGSAGRPFVNAHPDHDDDGEQSLDSDEYESVPDDGTVHYSDERANIQDYLTCETLPNWESMDFDNDNDDYAPESLIDLTDVKPGDCGEVTFSLHLCDNPGYIWIDGEPTVLEDPLAEKIRVEAWYDINCNNEFEKPDGDNRIVVGHPTTLGNFLTELEGGFQLTPDAYPHINGSSVGETGDGEPVKAVAGKIEWTKDGLELAAGTDGDIHVTGTDPLEYTVVFDDDGNTIILRLSNLKLFNGEPAGDENGDLSTVTRFEWELLDQYGGETSDADGMYELITESQGGITKDCFVSPCDDASDGPLWPFAEEAIKSTEWFYCLAESGPCFPAEETFCIGFDWCVPTWVGNEIQDQKVGWDLSFYTEQCRHNPQPSGP